MVVFESYRLPDSALGLWTLTHNNNYLEIKARMETSISCIFSTENIRGNIIDTPVHLIAL